MSRLKATSTAATLAGKLKATRPTFDCQTSTETVVDGPASLQPGCMVPQCCQMQSRKGFGGSVRPRQFCCRFEAKPLKVRSLRAVPSRIACKDFGLNNLNQACTLHWPSLFHPRSDFENEIPTCHSSRHAHFCTEEALSATC